MYSDRIDFFVLDVDRSDSAGYMEQYYMRSRSTYVLLDPQGETVGFWVGPLDSKSMIAQLDSLLAEMQQ